jgi:hypothetical protein
MSDVHRGSEPAFSYYCALEKRRRDVTSCLPNECRSSATIRSTRSWLAKVDRLRPSLWVRQTATLSDVQIVPGAQVRYKSLSFSPDGGNLSSDVVLLATK